jgi:hypothetical protein
MSWVQPKRFNWLPRESAWQQAQDWRDRHYKYQNQAESVVTGWNSIFTTTMSDLSYGMAKIAAQKAALRIQAQLTAARSASTGATSVDKKV